VTTKEQCDKRHGRLWAVVTLILVAMGTITVCTGFAIERSIDASNKAAIHGQRIETIDQKVDRIDQRVYDIWRKNGGSHP